MYTVFQNIFLYVALGGLAVALTLLAVRSETLRVVQARLLALWGALTPSGRVISVSLLAISILYGGGKTNSLPRMMTRSSALTQLTYAQKKAQNWNIRGAWKDSFWLNFADGWHFPYGTNHHYGVEVISFGELWQTPFDNNAIASLGAPAEIVPMLSSFLYEFTPSNSYRFVWENAAINRDTNNLLTASLELFRNGDACIVTNGVATYKERELPSEWGDSSEDGFYGNDNTLPSGADEDAYYWVDLVVSNATAKVKFIGEGASNYPDPNFVAKENTTNRVVLLIGKPYTVTCDEAIGIIAKSDEDINVEHISENEIKIIWPLQFDVSHETMYATTRATTTVPVQGGFIIETFPLLTGVYIWETNKCCDFKSESLGKLWKFSCQDDCYCTGCSFEGVFVYEGYRHPVVDLSCGCTHKEESSATASISFSKSAVIFENCYTNAPNDIVPRRSTTNSLDITIHGGPFGGSAEIEFDDKGKLEYLTQEAIPRSISVAAEQTLELSFPFIAKEESASENDIKASLKFTEYFTADTIESEDEMTAVRVEVVAEADWPENKNRHVFGPAEIAIIKQSPSEPKVYFAQLLPNGGGVMANGNEWQYTAPTPSSAMIYRINGFCDGGGVFSMYMKTLTPTGYSVFEIRTNCFSSAGQSGGFLMVMKMRLNPLTVSFENLELIEIPRVATNAVGYYAQESKTHLLDHGRHGAGNWVEVAISNLCFDTVQMGINDPPWLSGGSFTWPIPNAWRVSECEEMLNQFINTDQTFILEPNGDSRVRKFGFIGEKKISGELTIRRE